MFNYDVVERQVKSVYAKLKARNEEITEQWCLDDVLEFFRLFYHYHNLCCRYAHPFLKNKTIEWIIQNLSWCYGELDRTTGCIEADVTNEMEFDIEIYREIIPQYFRTHYDNCDYSIVHFMSGCVRFVKLLDVGGYY